MPKTKPDEPDAEPEVELEPEPEPFDPSKVVYPINVYLGEGVERTSIDGVEYAVDPETGRVTMRADDPAAPPVTPEPEPVDEADLEAAPTA